MPSVARAGVQSSLVVGGDGPLEVSVNGSQGRVGRILLVRGRLVDESGTQVISVGLQRGLNTVIATVSYICFEGGEEISSRATYQVVADSAGQTSALELAHFVDDGGNGLVNVGLQSVVDVVDLHS